jgi:two-component system, NtrC family, sensor kinase
MLIIRLFLLPAIVLFLVYGTIIYFFGTYSTRQVKNDLLRIATDHCNLIDQFLSEKSASLKFMAASFGRDALSDKATLERLFKNLQAESKAFFDVGVFDDAGDHIAYVGPFDLVGKSYAASEWFKAVQNKEIYISDEFLGFRKIPHFIIVVRRQEQGRIWYLRATIDTYYFNDLVENIRIGQTGEAYIINRDGILQTRKRSGGGLMEQDADFAQYRRAAGDRNAYYSNSGHLTGFLYASAPIHQTGWNMIVRQSVSDAYAPLAYSIFISLLILAGGGALVFVMGFVLASTMATRLKLADMETHEMKTQLILAGKMAEVGEMSTGIAHEINNPLQVMKSEVAMIHSLTRDIEALVSVTEPDKLALLKDSAHEIGVQIDRCSKITQGLLNFARKQDSFKEPISLQHFVPKMVGLVDQRARLENIRIVQNLEAQLPDIVSDANQLQQVFLNLFNNAVYALKGRPSAEIRVRVYQEDTAIAITVADNGCGFSSEDMKKAFVPFFSTKPVGQGTGLGLSTVYGIIKGMGGDITLTSQQGVGSEFKILLPINSDATTQRN